MSDTVPCPVCGGIPLPPDPCVYCLGWGQVDHETAGYLTGEPGKALVRLRGAMEAGYAYQPAEVLKSDLRWALKLLKVPGVEI